MARFLLVLLVLGGLTSCQSDQARTAEPQESVPAPSSVIESLEPTPAPTPEPVALSAAEGWGQQTYLSGWLPDGFSLTSIERYTTPEEIRVAPPVEGQTLTLGDSEILSETSVIITARRFDSVEDLERAVWVEDALMVVSGGPESTTSIEGAVFAYDSMRGVEGGQFHAVIDDVLVTGLILGPLSREDRERLVSSLILDADEFSIEVDHEGAGLTELARAEVLDDEWEGYELSYSNGTKRFVVMVHPGRPESTISTGSFTRSGDLLEAERGSGFLELQPEVGGAVGSERLVWWVPTVRLQVWFGGTLSTDEAIRVADSFQQVDLDIWGDAIEEAAISDFDIGPLNLPEDPAQTFADRVAELERSADEIGERPEIDIDDIVAFVGELRRGEMRDDLVVEWLGPVEADQATSGMNFYPNDVRDVLLALWVTRASDGYQGAREDQRRDVRGICCGTDGVILMEGMEPGEAAVVAAHEFTHFFDVNVLGAQFHTTTELFDPASALREGNANRVMRAYRDAREIRFNLDARLHIPFLVANSLRRSLTFAYEEGETFATAVAAQGGEAAIDAAFSDRPPLSTEHILHPDHYFAGDVPEVVEAPEAPADVAIEHRGTLGAFVIAMAADHRLDWDEAVELAGGWAGDSFIAWSEGPKKCVSATIRFDDDQSAAQFVDAIAAETGVANGRVVQIDNCSR